MTQPPNYYTAAPVGTWRHNLALGKAASICYVLTAVAAPFSVVLSLWVKGRLEDGDADLEDTYLRYTGFSGLLSVPALVALVLVIILSFRLSKNHQIIGRPGTTFGPGWAIAGWLIPLASVIIPFMQFDQLWRGSDPDEAPHSPAWKARRGSNLIYLWWAAVLIGTALGVVLATRQALGIFGSFNFSGGGVDYEEFLEPLGDNVGWQIAASAVSAAGGVLGALSLHALVKRQNAFAARHGLTGAHYSHSYGYPSVAQPPAGWHPDPSRRHELRYWDGVRWSQHVSDAGQVSDDPLH